MKLGHMLLAGCIMVTACAGRDAAPVQITQAQDATLDCFALRAQLDANAVAEKDLRQEANNKIAQNVFAGIAGWFLILPFFAMDFKGGAETDLKAMQARTRYLSTLTANKCAAPTTQEARAPAPLPTP